MSLPESSVPDWFNHPTEGSSVTVQLPPNWLDRKVSGLAICAVQKHHSNSSSPFVSCLCTFKGNRSEHRFSFDFLSSISLLRSGTSDNTFLGYVAWCFFEELMLQVDETYTEATFQIVEEGEQLGITSCGVRFVYANPDEMLNLNMPQPQVHVDSCETGICLINPDKLRNKETERVEIESSSNGLLLFQGDYMEVQNESMTRSTIQVQISRFWLDQLEMGMSETECGAGSLESGAYQTLVLLPEARTERKNSQSKCNKENELMGIESLAGRGLLGPLCSCFYWLSEAWRGKREESEA